MDSLWTLSCAFSIALVASLLGRGSLGAWPWFLARLGAHPCHPSLQGEGCKLEETQFWDGHSYIVRARELTGQLRCLPDAQRPEFQGRMAKERFPVGRPLTLMAHMLTQYRLQKRDPSRAFYPEIIYICTLSTPDAEEGREPKA